MITVNLSSESIRVVTFSGIDASELQDDILSVVGEYLEEKYKIKFFDMMISVRLNDIKFKGMENHLMALYNYRLVTNQSIERISTQSVNLETLKKQICWILYKFRSGEGQMKKSFQESFCQAEVDKDETAELRRDNEALRLRATQLESEVKGLHEKIEILMRQGGEDGVSKADLLLNKDLELLKSAVSDRDLRIEALSKQLADLEVLHKAAGEREDALQRKTLALENKIAAGSAQWEVESAQLRSHFEVQSTKQRQQLDGLSQEAGQLRKLADQARERELLVVRENQ